MDDGLRRLGTELSGQMNVDAKFVMLKNKVEKKRKRPTANVGLECFEIDGVMYFEKHSDTYNCLDVLKI